jgi:hypothetical protein
MTKSSCALFLVIVAAVLGRGITLAADPKDSSRKSEGLEIHLIVTAKGGELFRTWNNPTGKPFKIDPVKAVQRGPMLSAVVLFKGCKPDPAGNCDVDLDIVAYDPARKVYGEMIGVELWKGKAAPAPGFMQLGMEYMGIVIEPKDPSGTYRLSAVARDRIAKSEARSNTSFEVK